MRLETYFADGGSTERTQNFLKSPVVGKQTSRCCISFYARIKYYKTIKTLYDKRSQYTNESYRNYKSIDKKLFYEFTCQNLDESETGLMQERDQKRDSAKNIF